MENLQKEKENYTQNLLACREMVKKNKVRLDLIYESYPHIRSCEVKDYLISFIEDYHQKSTLFAKNKLADNEEKENLE